MVTALFVLMALPLTILFLGALLAKLPLRDNLPDYLRAMAAALLYAMVIAGIGLLVAAMTPRRGLGVAAVISVLLDPLRSPTRGVRASPPSSATTGWPAIPGCCRRSPWWTAW